MFFPLSGASTLPPYSGPFYIAGEADRLEGINQVPPDVWLPPAHPKARRARISVVVFVPVFAPGRQLQRAKPPDVFAGISFLRVIKVRQAIDETLHV